MAKDKSRDRIYELEKKLFMVKRTSRFYNFFRSNPLLQVFTEEYFEETEYIEYTKRNVHKYKLKSDNYDIDAAMKLLMESGYQFNCHIPINITTVGEDQVQQVEEPQKTKNLTLR